MIPSFPLTVSTCPYLKEGRVQKIIIIIIMINELYHRLLTIVLNEQIENAKNLLLEA